MRLQSTQRLIVALDYTELPAALAMARRLRSLIRVVKVGSVLFTAYGPKTVEQLRSLGLDVMLDLKFFDIPSTVELSCRAAAALGASLITVHASGEPEMLKAAVRGARAGAKKAGLKPPVILGVTVLTSVGKLSPKAATHKVLQLAKRAQKAGCGGIVASAQEASALRSHFGSKLKIVCPGIRPRNSSVGDQQRVATPAQALKAGADYLVIGRPITAAVHPKKAVQTILKEMEGV